MPSLRTATIVIAPGVRRGGPIHAALAGGGQIQFAGAVLDGISTHAVLTDGDI